VTNVGVVTVHPGVTNIVPARCELVHEMREPDPAALQKLGERCVTLARRVARRHGVEVEVRPLSATTPALCAPRVQSAVEKAATAQGLACQRMYSAAGHDAQNLTAITDAGMLFIPSKGGRSHRVDEMSDWDAIERGANVLLQTLLTLAA
jgi:N-carbamoyl-L-amino-acid hydrolase